MTSAAPPLTAQDRTVPGAAFNRLPDLRRNSGLALVTDFAREHNLRLIIRCASSSNSREPKSVQTAHEPSNRNSSIVFYLQLGGVFYGILSSGNLSSMWQNRGMHKRMFFPMLLLVFWTGLMIAADFVMVENSVRQAGSVHFASTIGRMVQKPEVGKGPVEVIGVLPSATITLSAVSVTLAIGIVMMTAMRRGNTARRSRPFRDGRHERCITMSMIRRMRSLIPVWTGAICCCRFLRCRSTL